MQFYCHMHMYFNNKMCIYIPAVGGRIERVIESEGERDGETGMLQLVPVHWILEDTEVVEMNVQSWFKLTEANCMVRVW